MPLTRMQRRSGPGGCLGKGPRGRGKGSGAQVAEEVMGAYRILYGLRDFGFCLPSPCRYQAPPPSRKPS